MAIIDDFASIGSRLSEIEKKIPKPESDTANHLAETIVKTWMDQPVVWPPEYGYSSPAALTHDNHYRDYVETARNQLYAMYGIGYLGDPD
jgi:hypothetical protein